MSRDYDLVNGDKIVCVFPPSGWRRKQADDQVQSDGFAILHPPVVVGMLFRVVSCDHIIAFVLLSPLLDHCKKLEGNSKNRIVEKIGN